MLHLKNIKITSAYAEADYYPESSQEKGYIKIALPSGDVLAAQMVEEYGEWYLGHAIRGLRGMVKAGQNWPEKCIAWY